MRGHVERTLKYMMDMMTEVGLKEELPDEMSEMIRVNQNKYIDVQFQNCCRKLLKRIFLVRDKQEDAEQQIEKAKREYDYTDQDEVNQFNREMEALMKFGFVILEYERGIPVISKIKLNTNSINEIYAVLKREDVTEKRNREIKMYTQYLGVHDSMDAFCKRQIERLRDYKNANDTADVAINILKLLKYILQNKSDIIERELSVAVLGDTNHSIGT